MILEQLSPGNRSTHLPARDRGRGRRRRRQHSLRRACRAAPGGGTAGKNVPPSDYRSSEWAGSWWRGAL